MNKFIKSAVILTLAVLIIVSGPLIYIWSLNELFDLGISYSVTTWAAVIIVLAPLSLMRAKN